MIRHSREQVSKSPATWLYNEFIILQSLKTFTIKSKIRHCEWLATVVNKFPSPLPPDRTTNLLYCNEFIILQSLKTFTIKSIIHHSEWFPTAVNKFPSP